VEVGGSGVGEAKTAGRFELPVEQAVRLSKNKLTKTLFKVDISPIIPDETARFFRRVDSKYNIGIPVFGKLK